MIIPLRTPLSLLISILLLTLTTCSPSQCPLIADQVDNSVLAQHTIPCLEKALRNSWTQIIDHLVKERQDKHKDQFIALLQQELKRLEILEEDIVLGTSETEPILKWGQNRTHVFITFKLSHRWDSPPCLYTQSQQSRLETDAFFYNNVCVVSHQKVNFKVNLNLYRSVMLSMKEAQKQQQPNNKASRMGEQVSQESQENKARQHEPLSSTHTNYSQYQFDVKKDGVGQYSTILLKRVPEIWIFLTEDQKSYPNWHEISERFPQDFKEYEQSLSTHRYIQRQRQAEEMASRPPVSASSQL